MALLQDYLGFGETYFNFLDMCANRTFKKEEERRACLFDVDDFVDFPSTDFPAAIAKSEYGPPICRVPTPYNQSYSLPAARPGAHHEPYLYRKSIFVPC